jgi:hypothetical protein
VISTKSDQIIGRLVSGRNIRIEQKCREEQYNQYTGPQERKKELKKQNSMDGRRLRDTPTAW